MSHCTQSAAIIVVLVLTIPMSHSIVAIVTLPLAHASDSGGCNRGLLATKFNKRFLVVLQLDVAA